MIVLLDGVGNTLKWRRWMIEFSRDFNSQLRMSRHGVIINRDSAISGHELAVLGQHQRIDFQRARLNAACGAK